MTISDHVAAPLWLWSGRQGAWYFLTVPADQAVAVRAHGFSAERRGFGSVRVEATVSSVTWRTSVFQQVDGGYILPVKAEVRRRAGIAAGDIVTVELELL